MIQRFVIGKPFPTESVVLDLPAETGPVPYLTPDGDGWQYVMQEKDIVYGLGEMPRGLNKRGWHYETNTTTMNGILDSIGSAITTVSDFVCGYPLFILLIGGGLFLFFYSGAVSLCRIGYSIKALRYKSEVAGEGQISSFQALMSAIASTVGMGNIAGVAIAITVGGPGAIFWMWVSAVVGMSTKFFEGALAIMYKGHDSAGEPQGGTMYIILHGLGERWKPFAYFFAVVGLIGTLCVMQANQLVESVTTVFTTPAGIENTLGLRFVMGIVISLVVGAVIIGGIRRISVISAKIVPVMVTCYMLLVFVILCLNFDKLPGVLASIFQSAFSLEAGIGGILGTALTGARRAAYVNEAGVGTASMMHGASRNDNPIREGLVAMIGPAIDSGLVCTLTAFPIFIAAAAPRSPYRHLELCGVV